MFYFSLMSYITTLFTYCLTTLFFLVTLSGVSFASGAAFASESAIVPVYIEIPAGSIDKWEFNKTIGELELDRQIRFIGYPGNYGFIPHTLSNKDTGGDGDPLDVLILGAPLLNNTTYTARIIGVLHLLDRGEKDDKFIAVLPDGVFSDIHSLSQLNASYPGITDIIETWFTHYKGDGVCQALGYDDVTNALKTLQLYSTP